VLGDGRQLVDEALAPDRSQLGIDRNGLVGRCGARLLLGLHDITSITARQRVLVEVSRLRVANA
jgi:hypothetical protein